MKFPFKQELPCQGKHKDKVTTDKDEAHQFLRPQEASKKKLGAHIKTQKEIGQQMGVLNISLLMSKSIHVTNR